jgi:hypothetical protein
MTGKQSWLAARWDRQLDRLDAHERRRARQLPGWRDRRHRRPLAALVVAGDLLVIAGAAILPVVTPWVFNLFWFGGSILAGSGYWLLRILTGRMSNSFSRLLDEREREWRHRITFVAYQSLIYLMIVGLAYGIFVSQQPDGGFRVVIMMAALVVTGSTIQSIVLGWTLPDDDPEDFLEGGEADE